MQGHYNTPDAADCQPCPRPALIQAVWPVHQVCLRDLAPEAILLLSPLRVYHGRIHHLCNTPVSECLMHELGQMGHHVCFCNLQPEAVRLLGPLWVYFGSIHRLRHTDLPMSLMHGSHQLEHHVSLCDLHPEAACLLTLCEYIMAASITCRMHFWGSMINAWPRPV